jgi:hypothetical protein
MLRYAAAMFLLIYSCIGCRTTSSGSLPARTIDAVEVQRMAQMIHAHIRSFVGEGRISVESPEVAQSGSFTLEMLRPDSISIRLQGPFGIKVGSALITRSDFLFYNSIENVVITGPSSMENLSRILHVQMNFDDMLNLFAGGTFFQPDLRQPDTTFTEDDQSVFVYSAQDGRRRYWIDPDTRFIQKIQWYDTHGALALEQRFTRFEHVSGATVPFSIRVIQPGEQRTLALTYSDVAVNTEDLHMVFPVSQNAKHIRW